MTFQTLLIIIFLLTFGYIVYYVIQLLIRQRYTEADTEAFISNTKGDPINYLDEESFPDRQLKHRDSHWFLMTSIRPGKEAIVKLRESNIHHPNYYYLNPEATQIEKPNPLVVMHKPSKLSYPKLKDQLTCVGTTHPVRDLIKHYQPYMYNEPKLVNHYDQPLYRDWRYPEQPIDIRFATNPEEFCSKNPTAYPCPKYYSKW